MLQPPEAACGRPHDAYPGRCAGWWPGRWPGSLDQPAHLPALTAAKPQVSGKMDLMARPGTDD